MASARARGSVGTNPGQRLDRAIQGLSIEPWEYTSPPDRRRVARPGAWVDGEVSRSQFDGEVHRPLAVVPVIKLNAECSAEGRGCPGPARSPTSEAAWVTGAICPCRESSLRRRYMRTDIRSNDLRAAVVLKSAKF